MQANTSLKVSQRLTTNNATFQIIGYPNDLNGTCHTPRTPLQPLSFVNPSLACPMRLRTFCHSKAFLLAIALLLSPSSGPWFLRERVDAVTHFLTPFSCVPFFFLLGSLPVFPHHNSPFFFQQVMDGHLLLQHNSKDVLEKFT